MAIYHLSIKPVSRGAGRSATAAAAYRAGVRVFDRTTEQVFDYSRKRGIEHSEIVLPASAAKQDIHWARDRQQLWNAAESAEKRKDARVAREYELALPHEFTKVQRVALVRAFAHELSDRYGVAVDFALHKPHRAGDTRNYHAHVLTTTRVIEATGLGAKAAIEWSDQDRGKRGLTPAKHELIALRERWAGIANQHLKEWGLEIHIDHRSLAAQGVDRVPTTHLGPSVSGMERRGIETEVGARIREQQRVELQKRLEWAAEAGRLARESHQVRQSILDVRSTLDVALKERAQGRDYLVAAKQGGRDALAELRRQAAEEKQHLQDLAREREKELEQEREAERQRQRERSRGLERDGPDFEG